MPRLRARFFTEEIEHTVHAPHEISEEPRKSYWQGAFGAQVFSNLLSILTYSELDYSYLQILFYHHIVCDLFQPGRQITHNLWTGL